jgi:hypothetical protein
LHAHGNLQKENEDLKKSGDPQNLHTFYTRSGKLQGYNKKKGPGLRAINGEGTKKYMGETNGSKCYFKFVCQSLFWCQLSMSNDKTVLFLALGGALLVGVGIL